ncbi:putative bifunctional diguanylate cyclase/phosphodiesterase [Marinobacter sp. DUT-1]|uniref:putative bifunctional diguanylate cyclase/phosphodiesterase n=1 Tax=Marinobacter sp. DUT-1 TaxID=3412037 RepID=UPI003D170537
MSETVLKAVTNPSLRILLVEDSEDDAVLLMRALRIGGLEAEYRVVDSEASIQEALQESIWDIVITDHVLPGFTSFSVLQLARQACPDLPVIIVSGLIGEDEAVRAMKGGAQDYIMKGNTARLIPAIQRELQEAQVRREKRSAESTLEHLAYHDSLTGLVNRREFERRLSLTIDETRSTGENHTLLFLDLDQFKVVNDTCGHFAGDELLKQLSARMKRIVRVDDIFARLGGDEFGILLRGCDVFHAREIAEKLCEEVREYRFIWEKKIFSISLSIGMAQIIPQTRSSGEALSQADLACYTAKDRGRDNVQLFQASDQDMRRRQSDMDWFGRLQEALRSDVNHFVLYYQQMQALSGSSSGSFHTEFLVRLKYDGDLVPPGAFIPGAERFGLMPRIDRRVIELAFDAVRASNFSQENGNTYFINLSGSSLSDAGLYRYIRDKALEYGIRPSSICFEITETTAISNLNETIGFIDKLRADGFKFALDDFGSGMSSFSYLKALPIDYLKIDGGFVRNMLEDPVDHGIVDACNRIAHAAGLQTIAEFVENDAIKDALTDLGIDYAQGYGIRKPMPLPLVER